MTPYLLLVSGQDRLADPAASLLFHQQAGSRDKQLVRLDRGRHNFYLERGDIRARALGATLDWIQRRIPGYQAKPRASLVNSSDSRELDSSQ